MDGASPQTDSASTDGELRRWRVVVAALVVLALAAGMFRVHNLDLGLHARTGQWIVENGSVPSTNVLSEIHADHPSVHDKWGFQVLAHALLDGLGPNAVIFARLLLLAGLLLVLAATARALGASPGSALLMLGLCVLAARSRFLFRPDLVSMLLLAIVVYVVLARRPDGRGTWPLILLQIVWVNVHGFFLLGYGTVLAVAAGHLLAGREQRPVAYRFGVLGLVMAAACLLNPAGLDGWMHPFQILTDLFEHRDFYTASIDEFLPTFATDPRQPWDRMAYFVLGLSALVLLPWNAFVRRRASAPADQPTHEVCSSPGAHGVAVAALVLGVVYGLMSRDLRRNMAPFAIVVAPLLAAAFTDRFGRRVPGMLLPLALVAALAFGELSDRISVHDGIERRAGWGRSRLAYPDVGIDFIASHLPDRRVFTAFRYGSTFTGRRWPEQVASTNGNTHGYPTSWLADVFAAMSDDSPLAFGRLTAAHEQDVALIPIASPLAARLLRAPDWTLVCLGRREAVFVRRAAVAPGWLAQHDLERVLAAGGLPEQPGTDPRQGWLGAASVVTPLTELDTAALLAGAGYGGQALQLARRALAVDADHPEALALCGLLELARGNTDEARALLERSLELGGSNRLAVQAREALAEG